MRRGSILVLSLWSVFLLSVFAVILGSGVRQMLTVVKRLGDRDRLSLAVQAGAKRACALVAANAPQDTYFWRNGWASGAALKEIPVGDCLYSVSYEESGRNGKVTVYGISDEESRMNVNTASPESMKTLFTQCGLDEETARDIAFSIADWRDEDSVFSTPTGSAEDSYYRNLPEPYEAKDAPLELVEELMLVKGVTRQVYDKISPYVTVYGNTKININTAPAPVLRALGMSETLVNKIIEHRRGKDGIEPSGDDNVFASVDTVTQAVTASFRLTDAELAELSNCVSSDKLCVNAAAFRAVSYAYPAAGKGFAGAQCIMNSQGNVLFWKEW